MGTDDISLTIGHLYKARVSEHLPHGLNIDIEAKDGIHKGRIDLADLSDTYDKKVMNQYPIGKLLRIVVSAVDEQRRLVSCSIRVKESGNATTSDSSDLFSGIPNDKGFLCLEGYAKDIKRRFELLEWVALLAADYYPKPVPHNLVVDRVIEHLLVQYNAKSVDRRGAANLLFTLAQGVEPLVQKVGMGGSSEGRGYVLTEFGWGELGGLGRFVVADGARDTTKTHEKAGDATGRADDTIPAPPAATVSLVETSQDHNPLDDELIRIFAPLRPGNIKEKANSDLDEVSEYVGKMSRLIEVRSQTDSLVREQEQLEAWLRENSHLRLIADRVYKRFINGVAE